MTVKSTKKSLPARYCNGVAPQLSAPAAVPRSSTTEGLLSHPEPQVRALAAMMLGILAEGTTHDFLFLAMRQGQRIAMAAGVSQEDWDEGVAAMESLWQARKKRHPFGDFIMF